ncbi:3-methyl-2-oxobutanoate hydroxymethyltransferase [Leptospira fainei serovar Hurstbridge str. BUT 6]|uniref:3-methyl-2-oxobutanoate hydroxymethyltransferase n=1 Tax=Leptospira fainei serovar Hurstbridge str. BUT 6 TaxID=1193011 RepID=S3VCX5_9LEPT|nr:3-methyl-2-oxobutanoate hydroxymethyltransferase [Leptospira fainei]EPG74355.1 3-methyl-2-oxobutanoate hydroxymethyltransferase [Leptospira fainei serovar Hurstbridge str. BUT 6]
MRDVHKIFPKGKKPLERKISVLTCYDYIFARILGEADVDCILVGDTLGVVVQGNRTTLSVTLDEMIYHAKMVRRGAPNSFIVVDLPFLSYQVSLEEGIRSAGRIMKETDCDAVKFEGGSPEILELIYKLEKIGIPVMGHIGLTPQSVNAFGGHKIQGKAEEDKTRLINEAKGISAAGAFSIVLELIPSALASAISSSVPIPTIGIGAGASTDGQVLVLYDFLGLNKDFHPKFLKTYMNGYEDVSEAVRNYVKEVSNGIFPGPEHSH